MKTIFQKSIEAIKEDQKNLTGGFRSDPNLANNVYNLCRKLEKAGKVDKYISKLTSPLALLFVVNLTNKHGMTILGDGTDYSFWQTDQSTPIPVASTGDFMFWNEELYVEKLVSPPNEPKAPIVHRYPIGHFL